MNLAKSFSEEKYNIRAKSHRSAVGLTDFLERIPNFTSSILSHRYLNILILSYGCLKKSQVLSPKT